MGFYCEIHVSDKVDGHQYKTMTTEQNKELERRLEETGNQFMKEQNLPLSVEVV
jgi:hypothetical protein